MNVFDILIWLGAALTLIGVGALVWCVVMVARARQAGLEDEALRQRMRQMLVVNMAALGMSMIGLMLVITGIFLGR